MAVRWVYHCVCIYRCIHLKELAVRGQCNVTDAGMGKVICRCNQLRVLNLKGLNHITGVCALCEDPEPTLCFITVCCMIVLQQGHTDHNVPPLDHILSRYDKAHTFKTLSLILHCIACSSQIHPIITSSSISLRIWAVNRCVPSVSTVYFYWPNSITFSHAELN
jgi:uncharacterized protein YjaG (DUF416 family)